MNYPALDVVRCDNPDLLLAAVDDFSATAIEERADTIRVFFKSARARDEARTHLGARFDVAAVDVPDEDWARRSQQNLQPITVGRMTIVPTTNHPNPKARIPNHISIVIAPSMGFGTGHHATTRLCLEALQTIDLRGKAVVDAGTGSGILAIAAARLGAASVAGLDDDPDAIQAARENLALNPAPGVTFAVGDLRSIPLGTADVVTANLTGALLTEAAAVLIAAIRPPGCLILSGLQAEDRDAVVDAFGGTGVEWERREDEWVGLKMTVNHPAADSV
ncbi:MAG TPA: 50S ribosomal protein L11 methyltransferase [Vicinamibacterales bacterium]|nr:50S ribosomal protein L11 methyltransferase [Vicinamibacterales bacterium]